MAHILCFLQMMLCDELKAYFYVYVEAEHINGKKRPSLFQVSEYLGRLLQLLPTRRDIHDFGATASFYQLPLVPDISKMLCDNLLTRKKQGMLDSLKHYWPVEQSRLSGLLQRSKNVPPRLTVPVGIIVREERGCRAIVIAFLVPQEPTRFHESEGYPCSTDQRASTEFWPAAAILR